MKVQMSCLITPVLGREDSEKKHELIEASRREEREGDGVLETEAREGWGRGAGGGLASAATDCAGRQGPGSRAGRTVGLREGPPSLPGSGTCD